MVYFPRCKLLAILLSFGLAITTPVEAATKKKPAVPGGVKIDPTAIFAVDTDAGKSVSCVAIKGKNTAGVLKKKVYFVPTSYTLKVLKKDAKSAKGAKLKKIKKKIAALKTELATNSALCVAGPDALTPMKRLLTEDEVRYLADKTAFGVISDGLKAIGTTQGAGPLVDALMAPQSDAALETDSAKWLDEQYATDSATVTQDGVRLWALNLMLKSANPFNERFAFLFLHNMLATSMEVLTGNNQSPLMVEHLNKIRAGAIDGGYPALLKEISRDPVMLIWLTGNQNTKQQPNENFARELMELFTIAPASRNGTPNYSEETVAQVARACTGWTVQNLSLPGGGNVWSSVFGSAIHDPDPNKVIFEGTPYQASVENDFNVIDHIFQNHPNTPAFLATRLAKEYLNETPSDRIVDALSKELKKSNFNLRTVLAKLLKSEEFYKDANRNSVIRGPVEKLVSFLRATNIPYDLISVQNGIESSGQLIGMPPTVFGWDNPEWTNGAWLLTFVNQLTNIVRDANGLFTAAGFSYTNLLPSPSASDVDTINHIARLLNVKITPDQLANLTQYLNNRLNANNSLTADAWDATNSTKVRRKVAGLVEIIARSNDFQMR